MAKSGRLKTKIEATYRIAEVHDAVAHAAQNQRGGKILLKMS
jgi:NADPH:quinone reductase-like Zn-dependent oxidoreductase